MLNLEIAKVLIIIDPTKELPEAVNAQFVTGEISRIKVSCPWLPPICKHCQALGHSIRRCPTAPITCPGCNSSAHTSENCPRKKKKSATSVITDTVVNDQEKPFSKGKNKKLNSKGSAIDTLVGAALNPTVNQPLHSDKSRGKSKAIWTTRVPLSPKPKKGRSLVVDIGLEELRASSLKGKLRKKAPLPIPPSKTSSSTSAVSCSDSDSLSGSDPAEESEHTRDFSSSSDWSSSKETPNKSDSGFTPVLSKKQKQQLRKHKASGKGPQYYLQ